MVSVSGDKGFQGTDTSTASTRPGPGPRGVVSWKPAGPRGRAQEAGS